MTAIQRSRSALLCLSLAVASLWGVFAILSASSADASPGEVPSPAIVSKPDIIIQPGELQATLYPGQTLTQSLWITNNADAPITYTIYEMTSPFRAGGYTLAPIVVPLVDPQVQAQVAANGKALVIIRLREMPDLSQASLIPEKSARRQYVYNRLVETASHSQSLFDWLVEQGAQPKRFIVGNAIAATVDASQLDLLAQNPLVGEVRPNRQVFTIPDDQASLVLPRLPALTMVNPEAVEWNIAMIRADQAWSALGITGEGAVVGIIDTGVLYNHSALVNSYRGSLGGGTFDHNFNWFDFVNGAPVPYDGNGHGTMITGIVTGDDGGANQIGVAPGAAWIAAKVCSDGGSCTDESILQGFEWMMAPYDLSGQDPDPTKAPDIVFGGWGGGSCDHFFDGPLSALRAAGILPIFVGGHNGPACATMSSLGDLGAVVTAGMTDQDDAIFYMSPRGPGCNGVVKPDVVAPGVDIRSSYNDGGYMIWSGSAESSAHLAGVAALIVSADPSLAAGTIEPILYSSSICHADLACGGDACPGPNNVYGYGRIDAYAAVSIALGSPPHTDLPWLSEDPVSGTIVNAAVIQVTFDSTGLQPGSYTGALGIISSDQSQPFTIVPVTLDVLTQPTPQISIDPLSFSADLPAGGVQTDTLTIRNDGEGALSFHMFEISRTLGLLALPNEFTIPDPYPSGIAVQVDDDVRTQLLLFDKSRLILFLRGGLDLSAASDFISRVERGQYVYDQLLSLASRSAGLYDWLQSQGTGPRRLLAANAIAVTLNASQLDHVLEFSQVGRVSIDGYSEVLRDGEGSITPLSPSIASPSTVEWNIAKIRADEAWSTFGITGQGAVIGVIDTGVTYDHPALVDQYRGTLGGGLFDHNYNWFDLVNGTPVPYDDVGHGTMGMGVAVGSDGGLHQIGVAPGARWIAVKACSSGLVCSDSDLLAAADWMLAPTRLDGTGADPSKAPQVVLNMWGGAGCNDWFQSPITALRAAGILPVFATGGSGPGCSTMASPADYPDVLTAGTTDIDDIIAPFSARGPSCYAEVKPDLSAPGVEIRTSDNVYSYTITSGTSWAAAHAAGSAAMVISADPSLDPDEVEELLFSSAVCIQDLACGGEACPGPNNVYGHGRIDVYEAVSDTLPSHFDVPWLVAGPLEGELQPGEAITTSVVIDAAGLEPGIYHAGIAVASNDPSEPFTTLPVTLTVSASCQPVSNMQASFTPLNPYVGEPVTFSAAADGTLPITYTWDIDGMIMPGQQVTYAFPTAATYVTLVTFENTCSDPVMLAVEVPVSQKVLLPVISK